MILRLSLLLALAVLPAFLFAGCVGQPSAGQEPPAGPPAAPTQTFLQEPDIYGTWTLVTMNAGGRTSSVLPQTTITGTFSPNGTVSGMAGCNNYAATCQVTGNRLAIGKPAYGKVGCRSPTGVMDQEAIFLTNLQGAETYELDADRLTIHDLKGNTLLVFERGGPPADLLPIAGIPWNLDIYRLESGMQMPVDPDTSVTALFDPSGNLTGSAGCNNYSGSVEVRDGQGLSIGPLATTKMYCGEYGVMAQEAAYLALLQNASSYDLTRDGILTLRNATGTGTLVYSS